jgi:glycosyltransferase involved in cell wall biosynthesis
MSGATNARKLAYAELVTPRLDLPASSTRALYWLSRDFPWLLDDGWNVEWWGVRTHPGGNDSSPRYRVRGPRLGLARLPWALLAPVAWISHFVMALRAPRSTIVMARHPYLALGVAAARLLKRSPCLVVGIVERMASRALNVHGSKGVYRLIDAVDRFVMRRADLVILMGPFTRELADRAGVDRDQIVEIPHPPKWDISGGNALPRDERRVVCAARLIRGKGVDVLVNAWPSVLKKNPDAVLIVAGEGPEGPRLRELAERLGVSDRVEFPGWVAVHDLPALYGSALVTVLPSRVEEGHPMALQEAALAGCALVGSDLGGIRDVVDAGRTGLLVPPEDPRALAAAICTYLEDPAAAKKAGDAGRAAALAYYERRTEGLAHLRMKFEDLIEA